MYNPMTAHCISRYQARDCDARQVLQLLYVCFGFGLSNWYRYSLGCWATDAYVAKYDLPTTNCEDGVPDSSIFYTNSNAIADVSYLFRFYFELNLLMIYSIVWQSLETHSQFPITKLRGTLAPIIRWPNFLPDSLSKPDLALYRRDIRVWNRKRR